jgi:hypothetical protein
VAEPADDPSLKAYAGRWVATIRGRVVGHGGTPTQAIRSAQAARFKERATIMYVPTESPMDYPPILGRLQAILKNTDEVYLVGGVVRDALLGRQAHDIDLILPAQAIRTAREVADQIGAAFFPLKESYDAARLILPKAGGIRMVIDFIGRRGADLLEDLQARDF